MSVADPIWTIALNLAERRRNLVQIRRPTRSCQIAIKFLAQHRSLWLALDQQVSALLTTLGKTHFSWSKTNKLVDGVGRSNAMASRLTTLATSCFPMIPTS